MTVFFERNDATFHLGDCVEVLRAMPEASIDACVCDPPYGLEFMGKEWDKLGAEVVDDPSEIGGFMRHLVKLVTPPKGTVLDPFLGSGTTAIAAGLEGFRFVGIDREAEYLGIAKARFLSWTAQGDLFKRVAP